MEKAILSICNKLFYLTTLLLFLCTLYACDDELEDENFVGKFKLKACSFNIRFDNDGDGANQWENRRKDVVRFIGIEKPDIVGFQEVLVNQLNYMRKRLTDYKSIGIGRDDGLTEGEFNPVFYKIERFELIDSGTFWLSTTPGIPSLGWDALINRICTWAFLEDKESGEVVHFYNTHFSHVGSQARTESVKLIMDSIRAKSSGERVILTGDLNAEPDSELYKIAVNEGFMDSFYSDIQLGPIGTFNGFNTLGPYNRRIDYIFFKGFKSDYYYCSTLLLDNSFLSDHFAIFSMLEYDALD